MEELYNKWQLQDKDLGNTELYQFTKSELLDFAKYYFDSKEKDILLKYSYWIGVNEFTMFSDNTWVTSMGAYYTNEQLFQLFKKNK